MTDQAHRPMMIGHRPWCDTADHDGMPCTSAPVEAIPDWDDELPATSWLIDRPEAPVLFVDMGGRGLYLEREDARVLAGVPGPRDADADPAFRAGAGRPGWVRLWSVRGCWVRLSPPDQPAQQR